MSASRLVLACLLSACGAPDESRVFIALERDFQAYASWESVTFETAVLEGTDDQGHTGGPRRVYFSERPPEGATEFPVGTRIVKELLADGTIFASAKRGGSYNLNGATGWEWFELKRDSAGAVRFAWRGLGAPVGGEYGKSGQSCNSCHASVKSLDGVMTPQLRLQGQ